MTRILAIGNSFSEDATYYLSKIAASAGMDVRVVNLYIGGCTLESHAENIRLDRLAYRYEENGMYTQRRASISEILQEEPWDIVTIQQESSRAGIYESYGIWLGEVLACIRRLTPSASIFFHETWAYEWDSTHTGFALYDWNQEKMHRQIKQTVARICRENGNLPIIPSGDVIAEVRRRPQFAYKNGGQSLCRDGYHMHLVYGRYLLGAVWFETLLAGTIWNTSFVPGRQDLINGFRLKPFDCQETLLEQIKQSVHSICSEQRETTPEKGTAFARGQTRR